MCAIMPERIASTDPFKAFTEVIGSGPFTFKASERVPGSLFVYEKFDKYKPRERRRGQFHLRSEGRALRSRRVARAA